MTGVGPRTNGQEPVQFFFRTLSSLVVLLLMFTGMVTAFHLLNLPRDLAVLEGVCLLLLLAAGGFIAFRLIWRRPV